MALLELKLSITVFEYAKNLCLDEIFAISVGRSEIFDRLVQKTSGIKDLYIRISRFLFYLGNSIFQVLISH